MANLVTPELFKTYLTRFTNYFISDPKNPEEAKLLRQEIDSLDKNEIITTWVKLLEVQGPVEKVSDNKYEIYDVNNFIGDANTTANDFIHLVEFTENENTASVFMKFYFVFYCLNNGIKSSNYQIVKREESRSE